MTAIYRVPTRFADYLHHMLATRCVDGSTCPGCGEHPTAYSMASPFHRERRSSVRRACASSTATTPRRSESCARCSAAP